MLRTNKKKFNILYGIGISTKYLKFIIKKKLYGNTSPRRPIVKHSTLLFLPRLW